VTTIRSERGGPADLLGSNSLLENLNSCAASFKNARFVTLWWNGQGPLGGFGDALDLHDMTPLNNVIKSAVASRECREIFVGLRRSIPGQKN
jgi:hypothetical protein